MKNFPSPNQTFKEIRTSDYIYVDKTEYLYKLITHSGNYFLSRPQGFGKSLILETIKEIFSGNRDFFKGLWINSSDYDFKKYPVLNLVMTGECNTADRLSSLIVDQLKQAARENNVELEDNSASPDSIFQNLVFDIKQKTGQKVVVLIDELDACIFGQLNNIPQALINRRELGYFTSSIKTMCDSDYIHFLLATGVTNFAKGSVFSGFNNLYDLTLDPKYAGICGFTPPEFESYFSDYLPDILEYNKTNKFVESSLSLSDFKKMVLDYYNGYNWGGKTKVINPNSLVKFCNGKRLESFWDESHAPTFFSNLIRETQFDINQATDLPMSYIQLHALDVEDLDLTPLLFLTGYLTIDDQKKSREYFLKAPNIETLQALHRLISKARTDR
jgi:hypothetical protein